MRESYLIEMSPEGAISNKGFVFNKKRRLHEVFRLVQPPFFIL